MKPMQELQQHIKDLGHGDDAGSESTYMPQTSTEQLIPWTKVDHARRRFRRWSVNMSAAITADGVKHNCGLHNVSPAGARISLTKGDGLEVGSEVMLEFKGYDPIPAAIQYHDSAYYGLMFLFDTAEVEKFATFLDTLRAAKAEAD